jgi:hypothetical protein
MREEGGGRREEGGGRREEFLIKKLKIRCLAIKIE